MTYITSQYKSCHGKLDKVTKLQRNNKVNSLKANNHEQNARAETGALTVSLFCMRVCACLCKISATNIYFQCSKEKKTIIVLSIKQCSTVLLHFSLYRYIRYNNIHLVNCFILSKCNKFTQYYRFYFRARLQGGPDVRGCTECISILAS